MEKEALFNAMDSFPRLRVFIKSGLIACGNTAFYFFGVDKFIQVNVS